MFVGVEEVRERDKGPQNRKPSLFACFDPSLPQALCKNSGQGVLGEVVVVQAVEDYTLSCVNNRWTSFHPLN